MAIEKNKLGAWLGNEIKIEEAGESDEEEAAALLACNLEFVMSSALELGDALNTPELRASVKISLLEQLEDAPDEVIGGLVLLGPIGEQEALDLAHDLVPVVATDMAFEDIDTIGRWMWHAAKLTVDAGEE